MIALSLAGPCARHGSAAASASVLRGFRRYPNVSSVPKIDPQTAPDCPSSNMSGERRSLQDALAHERNVLRTMIDMIPAFIYAKDAQSRFTACNKLVANRMGVTPEQLLGKSDFDFFPREMAEKFFNDEQALLASGKPLIDCEEIAFDKISGTNRVIVTSKVPLHDEQGRLTGLVGTGYDITERKAAEERLASSDRLESIGRLAAGVAHEINTPIQYLNDSVSFIREGVEELLQYIDKLHAAMPQGAGGNDDIDYMREELPPALTRVADGLSRIAEIVRSMKHFSHADQREMSQVDLNASIASTLVIARSEYKDVADVETSYGEIPHVTCHGGQINQVVLNLVVNSAHAISDLVKKQGGRGKIRVQTRVEEGNVVISIEDSGGGIPEGIRARIFDPFFTTKEVGRGTGQGLSIARNVIVKGHSGELDFVTEIGKGTTFYVRLPIQK
jgi:two-component system, NtrC family, sensor kinase